MSYLSINKDYSNLEFFDGISATAKLKEQVQKLVKGGIPILLMAEPGSLAIEFVTTAATQVVGEASTHRLDCKSDADLPGLFQKNMQVFSTLIFDNLEFLPIQDQLFLANLLKEKEISYTVNNFGYDPLTVSIPLATHLIAITSSKVSLGSPDFNSDRPFIIPELVLQLYAGHVTLPPLRDRPSDIAPLAVWLLNKNSSKKQLTASAREVLLSHSWPYNVLELEQVLIRANACAASDDIDYGDIKEALLPHEDNRNTSTVLPGSNAFNLAEHLQRIEREYIQQVLHATTTNVEAAVSLGMTPQVLSNKIRKLGINNPRGRVKIYKSKTI